MAKEYIKYFEGSMETQYGASILPITALGLMNTAVNFVKLPIPGSETGNTNPQFSVQRVKRVKAKDTVQDVTKGAGTNYTKRLDEATSIAWESIDITQGTKKDIIVKRSSQEQFADFLTNPENYDLAINNMIKNTMVEAEEKATSALWNAVTPETTILDPANKAQETADTITDAVLEVELLVDDYKAYSEKAVVIIHPKVAYIFAKLQGQSYYQGTNTFPNGFPKSFTYNNTEFYVSNLLNTIQDSNGNTAAAIIYDREAFKDAGANFNLRPFTDTLLDEYIVGHSYVFLQAVIDPARIKTFLFKPGTLAKSKTVNE